MKTYKKLMLTALAMGLTLAGGGAMAEEAYPSKPITFLVPYAAGANGDVVSRILGSDLQTRMGQPVVIDNRPGAGGNIGAAEAARTDPDGYTIMLGTNTHTINQALYSDAGYDLLTDFEPVSMVSSAPMVLLVTPSLPAKTVAEFIALAKTQPLNFSSGGNGASGHLFMELFDQNAGIKQTHIPYGGVAAGLTDLIAGRVQSTFSTLASAIEMIKGGQLRAIAIAAPQRSDLLPDVPTLTEAGIKGMESGIWQGVLVPAGTPAAEVAALNTAIGAALADEGTRQKLIQQGVTPTPSTPEAFGELIKGELVRWKKVVETAGVTLQ